VNQWGLAGKNGSPTAWASAAAGIEQSRGWFCRTVYDKPDCGRPVGAFIRFENAGNSTTEKTRGTKKTAPPQRETAFRWSGFWQKTKPPEFNSEKLGGPCGTRGKFSLEKQGWRSGELWQGQRPWPFGVWGHIRSPNAGLAAVLGGKTKAGKTTQHLCTSAGAGRARLTAGKWSRDGKKLRKAVLLCSVRPYLIA